jgi:hypothetical protein
MKTFWLTSRQLEQLFLHIQEHSRFNLFELIIKYWFTAYAPKCIQNLWLIKDVEFRISLSSYPLVSVKTFWSLRISLLDCDVARSVTQHHVRHVRFSTLEMQGSRTLWNTGNAAPEHGNIHKPHSPVLNVIITFYNSIMHYTNFFPHGGEPIKDED